MRIFCTGGSGFIGTNLVESLISQHQEVVNFDINPPRNRNHIEYWVEGDIRDSTKLIKTITNSNPNFIIHLAARTDLNGKNIEDYSTNTVGVKNIIKNLKNCPSIQLVLFASSRLVCRIGYQPKNDTDYCPTTFYGESKVIGEKIVRDESDNFPCPWLIFRPTSIWGPWFGTPYKEFFMSIINRHYVHPKKLSIKKSFGYVGNIVFMINNLINNFPQELDRHIIYMCDYQPIDVLDWANHIATLYGVAPPKEVDINLLKFIACCGDILKKVGFKEPPLTSFRLNNLITNMIYDTSSIEKFCGPLPYDQLEGIGTTLNWIRNYKR